MGIVIHPEMGITKVHYKISCKSHLINEQDVVYKLGVYNTFCEKPLEIYQPCMIVRNEGCGMGKMVRAFCRQGDH
jgi:hypothetical protein